MAEQYVRKDLFETKMKDHDGSIENLWNALSGKASNNVVYVLVGIITALLGIIYYTQVDMQKGQNRIETNLSSINTVLHNYGFEIIE